MGLKSSSGDEDTCCERTRTCRYHFKLFCIGFIKELAEAFGTSDCYTFVLHTCNYHASSGSWSVRILPVRETIPTGSERIPTVSGETPTGTQETPTGSEETPTNFYFITVVLQKALKLYNPVLQRCSSDIHCLSPLGSFSWINVL